MSIGDKMQQIIEQLEVNEQKLEEEERLQELKAARKNVDRLHACSAKFAGCTISNYKVGQHDKSERVAKRLIEICTRIREFVAARNQLFLWGTVGTGKDHLAFSVARVAARAGYSAMWVEGLEFYEQVAGAYSEKKTQKAVYLKYSRPTVLVLSDPVLRENWSAAKQEALRKLVRRRYDDGKATWVTCNLASLEQADEMFGVDTFDRLSERAVTIECRWPSYRPTMGSEF